MIPLNDQMGENQPIDVLLHEWGHALAWNHLLDRLANSRDTSPEEFEQASHFRGLGVRLRAGLEGALGSGAGRRMSGPSSPAICWPIC